jgi:hypothetical protein
MFQIKANAWPTTGTAYGTKGAFFPISLLCREILESSAVSMYVKMKGKQVKRPNVTGANVVRNGDARYELSSYTFAAIDLYGESPRGLRTALDTSW